MARVESDGSGTVIEGTGSVKMAEVMNFPPEFDLGIATWWENELSGGLAGSLLRETQTAQARSATRVRSRWSSEMLKI